MAKAYPGSKRGSGVAERIISEMPPHRTYVELFAGSAAVFEKKKRASLSVLVDHKPKVAGDLAERFPRSDGIDPAIFCIDALFFLEESALVQRRSTLIYADPPYLPETVSKSRYNGSFHDAGHHQTLLMHLLAVPCMCMISGYSSYLYNGILASWRRVDIGTMTRGGPRTECVWCNFPAPKRFHDVRFLGKSFRDRFRIKRKAARWVRKLLAMEADERQVIMTALRSACRPRR